MCSQCNSGYIMVLFNSTSTICGTLTTTANGSQVCTIDSTNYPYEANQAAANNLVFNYYDRSASGQTSYCFSCTNYFNRSGNVLCNQCGQTTSASSYQQQSVFSNSQGCKNCLISGNNNNILTYLTNLDLFMTDCASVGNQTAACQITEFYNTATNKCQSCSSQFTNCASCNQNYCLMCQDKFYNHTSIYQYSTGKSVAQCIFDVCPLGYCKDALKRKCVTSSDKNCQICRSVNGAQSCDMCQAGYQLNTTTNLCQQLSGTLILSLFVQGNAPVQKSAFNQTNAVSRNGSSPTNAFFFIQQAMNTIYNYQQAQMNSSIQATIYLGFGNHFHFTCQPLDYITTYLDAHMQSFVKYCTIFNLQKVYFTNDNIKITIQPLWCADQTKLGLTNDTVYSSMCLLSNQKPTIYIATSNDYFNISGQLYITNIIFSGLNQFVVPKMASQNYGIYPFALCGVVYEPYGDNKEYVFNTTLINSNNFFNYTCADTLYTFPNYIPSVQSNSFRCQKNGGNLFYPNQESTLACKGDPLSQNYFTQNPLGVYDKRKYTLFNLYAFPPYKSTYLKPPLLQISNCEFSYFMGGYSSLINVENNNLQSITKLQTITYANGTTVTNQYLFYSYYGAERGVSINISSSLFKHSRFCYGLIKYRKQLYMTSQTTLLNMTHVFMTNPNISYSGAYILLINNTFMNLNAHTNVTALAIYQATNPQKILADSRQLEPISFSAVIHKGIVLNIADFGGQIEIFQSTFQRNFHFIPEIFMTPRTIGYTTQINLFMDNIITQEFKISTCNMEFQTDQYMFLQGIKMSDDIDSLFNNFERLGLIYISRPQKPVIILSNTFTTNMGTFGGAITINSPNWKQGSKPYIIIQGNTFTNNMAYFSGNAIYIRNTKLQTNEAEICAGAFIDQNYFTQNMGMKAHNGGALAAVCGYVSYATNDDYLYTSTFPWQMATSSHLIYFDNVTSITSGQMIIFLGNSFTLSNSVFQENYSGQKGTGAYFRYINNIFVNNTVFSNNQPQMGYFEIQVASPWTQFFTGRTSTLIDTICPTEEEVDYIQRCYDPQVVIDWPMVKGALHIWHCVENTWCQNSTLIQNAIIQNSSFINNNAGPILDMSQIPELSSSLYIEGGYNNQLLNCTFRDHDGTGNYFVPMISSKLKNYFPLVYFKYSQAPLARFMVRPSFGITFQYPLNYTYTFINSTFFNNKLIQVLGLSDQQQFYGGLIQMETTFMNQSNYAPQIFMINCTIRDNQFIGNLTSLIYLFKGMISMTNCTCIGNGYLGQEVINKDKNISLYGSVPFPFMRYQFMYYQFIGIVQLMGSEQFPNGYLHNFTNNFFMFNFCHRGAAYYIKIDNQYVLFQNNLYMFNYGVEQAGVLYGRNQDGRTTFWMINDTFNYTFSGTQGAVSLEPHTNDYLAYIAWNATFYNCYADDGSSVYTDSVSTFVLKNCTFTYDEEDFDNRTEWVYEVFNQSGSTWTLLDFVDWDTFDQFTGFIVNSGGQVYMEQNFNDQAVYFLNQTLKALNDPYLAYNEIIDCNFTNIVTTQAGAAVHAGQQAVLSIRNTYPNSSNSIHNNLQQFGGTVYLTITTKFIGVNLNFYNNNALTFGGGMGISNATATLINCTFINNSAQTNGGGLWITTDSIVTCTQCTFLNNWASDSSAIFLLNNLKGTTLIQSSYFANNQHTMNLINVILSTLQVTNSTFLNNIGQVVNHGITLVSSTVYISAITVNYTDAQFLVLEQNVDSGFFSLNYMSSIFIANGSVFQNCRGAVSSVLYATGSSNVTLNNYNTIINSNSETGSVFYFTLSYKVVINDTVFINNGQYDIYMQTATVNISNSTFIQGAQQFIYATDSNLFVNSSQFLNGQSNAVNGKGIYCQCWTIIVQNSTFQGLSALEGGAIYITSSSPLSYALIFYNQFIGNSALHGGAIKFQDSPYGSIYQNTFSQNYATYDKYSSESQSITLPYGMGGAIFLDCYNEVAYLASNCSYYIWENQFQNNTASDQGGAISWISNNYNDSENVFYGNSAPYGNNVSSYAHYIVCQFTDNGDYYNPIVNNEGVLQFNTGSLQTLSRRRRMQQQQQLDWYNNSASFYGIVPGTPFSFVMYEIDQMGYLFQGDSSSSATLVSSDPNVILVNNAAKANRGIYNFTNVIIKVKPGSQITLTLQIDDLVTYSNNENIVFMANPFTINLQTRRCVAGEQYTEDNRCIQCAEGSFTLVAPTVVTACTQCNSSSTFCYGSSLAAPQPGYWRESNTSDEFFACPNPNACLGGNETNLVGTCAPGYVGVVCGNCEQGYKSSGTFECSQCPPYNVNVFEIIALLFFLIILLLVVIRSSLTSVEKSKPLYQVYLRILTNHLQILGAIFSIDFNWPKSIQNFSKTSSFLAGITENIFSFDCFLLQTSLIGPEDHSYEMLYLQKILLFTFLPVILFGLSFAFWMIVKGVKNYFYKFSESILDKLVCTIVILYFLVLPSITQVLFANFNCFQIDENLRLKQNVNMICYQGAHYYYSVGLVIPSCLLWTIGLPLLCLVLLLRNRPLITKLKKFSSLPKTEQAEINSIKMRYGFLFNGYKLETYYWEVVIIIRKILIVIGTVFLSTVSTDSQVLVLFFIFVVFIMLHIHYQPFYTEALNNMEHYSLYTAAITTYAGLFFVTGAKYDYMSYTAIQDFFLVLILLPNLIFLLYWCKHMRTELMKIFFIKSAFLFKILNFGMYTNKEFDDKFMKKVEASPYEPPQKQRPESVSQSLDDISNVIVKQFREEDPDDRRAHYRTGSVSEHEYGVTRRFQEKDLTLNDSDFERENKLHRAITKIPALNLDFPSHMLRKISEDSDVQERSPTKSNRITPFQKRPKVKASKEKSKGALTNRTALSSKRVYPQDLVNKLTARGLPDQPPAQNEFEIKKQNNQIMSARTHQIKPLQVKPAKREATQQESLDSQPNNHNTYTLNEESPEERQVDNLLLRNNEDQLMASMKLKAISLLDNDESDSKHLNELIYGHKLSAANESSEIIQDGNANFNMTLNVGSLDLPKEDRKQGMSSTSGLQFNSQEPQYESQEQSVQVFSGNLATDRQKKKRNRKRK